jgi:hypothetical protein
VFVQIKTFGGVNCCLCCCLVNIVAGRNPNCSPRTTRSVRNRRRRRDSRAAVTNLEGRRRKGKSQSWNFNRWPLPPPLPLHRQIAAAAVYFSPFLDRQPSRRHRMAGGWAGGRATNFRQGDDLWVRFDLFGSRF